MIDDAAEPTTPSVEERVTDDVTLTAVLAAFAKLSPEDQQLMRLLCAVPPIDYQAIAEMLGRPIGSIGLMVRAAGSTEEAPPARNRPKVGLS